MQVRLRFAILRTEVKLMLLFVGELFLFNPAALILIVEFPFFLVLLRFLEGGIYFKPIAFYASILLAAAIIRKFQLGGDRPSTDSPLSKPLDSYPALREIVKSVASRCRRSAPRHACMSLSPTQWRRFGVDLYRFQSVKEGLPLPIACLAMWSISELEAHIARTLVSHRGPSWLLTIIEWAIERLGSEQYQVQFRNTSNRAVNARAWALQKYIDALREWRFLVDLEADLKVAQIVGSDTVMSLAYKNELAQTLAPVFIVSVIEPAIDKQALLPIAHSYSVYASAVDPHWREAVAGALKEMERSPGSSSGSLIARLAMLSTIPPGVSLQDPRPAASLFSDFKSVEREVAANEFGTPRVDSAKYVDAANSVRESVIPQIRDEVDRNLGLLDGKTRLDIPSLLLDKANLATRYRTDPKFLLAHIQREQRIPYFLGAFLAISLIDEQWDVSYQMHEGIQLRLGNRQIQPFTLVAQLDAKAISDTEFTDAVK